MKQVVKKIPRHLVTFQDAADIETICLAELGLSTRCIQDSTGLSPNQISYRLFKAKKAEGYESGHTYRSEWRNGTGQAVRAVMNSLVPSLRKDAKSRLPELFEHPTPEISPNGKRE
jgi:hypothetical protein